jgi:hypothetical protein
MNGRTLTAVVVVLGGTLLVAFGVATPDVTPDDVLGILLSRFAWLGAFVAMALWCIALRRIWRIEGSLHHLVARTLSIVTMLVLCTAVILFFWPVTLLPSPLMVSYEEARILVAFIVGMSIMAAIWQLTAPPQARVPRVDGRRYR